MLKILIGPDPIANRNLVLSYIAKDVAEKKSRRILMVPELVSHYTERRLATAAGDTASRYAQVLSFSRLTRRVAEYANSAAPECLDQGGRVIAMASAVRQLSGRLKSYASLETKPEFLVGLLEAVDEFKRCCITTADLRSASAKTDGVLAQKLEELSLILDSYNSVTALGKRDPRDQMTWLLEEMEACDFASEHIFYFDAFPDFSRQHSAILEHIIRCSPQVVVSLCCDDILSQSMAFQRDAETARQLIRYASEAGVLYEILPVQTRQRPLNAVSLRLFQGNRTELPALHDDLAVFRADGLQEECQLAAQRILSLVRAGCRYRDIAVVCGDMPAYDSVLLQTLSRCNIPAYRSGKDDVLQKTIMSALLSALDVALNHFEQQDVLRYLKGILSPLSFEQCDLIENYAILWAVSGKNWTKPWDKHPGGLGCEWDENSRHLLDSLNEARAIAVRPLLRFSDAFQDADDLAGQTKAVYGFLEDISLADKLSDLADKMDAAGDNRSAQILNQLWDILVSALEQLHDVLGHTVWDKDSFTRLLSLLLSQYNVGTIPTVLDAVTVGPVNAMRCHEEKHLIILGMQEGVLPGYAGTAGILSDREREQLRRLDIPLIGGGVEGLQTEFAEIYGVFAGAEESIQASYSSGQPSFLFSRLASFAGGESAPVLRMSRLLTSPRDAASYLVAFDAREEAQALGISRHFDSLREKTQHSLGRVSNNNTRRLYGSTLNLSASQIDSIAGCRLGYFLRYGLRAKEIKEATVDPAEFGTYFHAVMEQTSRRVLELGGFHKVSLEETLELARQYSDEYVSRRFSALDSARVSYLFSRNLEELEFLVKELWMELSVSLFEPQYFELAFGFDSDLPAIDIPDTPIPAKVQGYVDRVDVYRNERENFFRIVDYKSGKKSFDYCDVLYGLGLQMLLYLFALEQGGAPLLGEHPIPAGVQYFSARFPHMSVESYLDEEDANDLRSKQLKRKGLVLQEGAVLSAMQPEGAPHRLSVEWRKKGGPHGDIASRYQFSMLKKHVFQIVKKLVEQISTGSVEPNPYTRGDSHNVCAYCPYKSVCHYSFVSGRRNYQKVDSDEFWNSIEKEVK